MNVGSNTHSLMIVPRVLIVHKLRDVMIAKAHLIRLIVFDACSH